MTQYNVTCRTCKKDYTIELSQADLDALNDPELSIQKALPNHTTDERELVKTQTCGSCWDDMFKDEGEEY